MVKSGYRKCLIIGLAAAMAATSLTGCGKDEHDGRVEVELVSYKPEAVHAFEKIAGRFKQYRFDRSLEENYQLLCSAFEKRKEYYSYTQAYLPIKK